MLSLPYSHRPRNFGESPRYFTHGDTEGDYTVTAACPDCTQGSPLTFTAKAKCAVPINAVIPLSQCGSGVGDQLYDGTSERVCDAGCALTALTMQLNFYGANTDVIAVNDWLKENNGYTPGGAVDWSKVAQNYPGMTFSSFDFYSTVNTSVLDSLLRQGSPVIGKIPSTRTHFVLAFCKNGSSYKVWDPGRGVVSTITTEQILGMRVFNR